MKKNYNEYMKKILITTIFLLSFNSADASFYMNPGFGNIYFADNGTTNFTPWGAFQNYVKPSQTITGNGNWNFDLYDLSYVYFLNNSRGLK